ncbi:helix-turn-helix domain-containing protein [Massilia oculi]|uniref:helix-turn-helix domain-containing protein n=1 Tax=Massilia oculi TaxID=945844 RepID=UPI001AAF657D
MKSIHDPRYFLLIELLKSSRDRVRVTQVELAQRLEKPQSYVAKVENLERRLDVVELVDWLRAIGEKPENFFKLVTWWSE